MIEKLVPTLPATDLSARQLEIILSYQVPEKNDPFATGFDFELEDLPPHGLEQISDVELAEIKAAEPISPEFQGQPDLTVAELSLAAKELLNSAAWKKLYEQAIPSTKDTAKLTRQIERFYSIYQRFGHYQGIELPFLDENIRKVVTTIFTTLPRYNAQSVYSILAANKAYGLFHRFCTQSFPVNVETKIAPQNRKKTLARSIMTTFLPQSIRNLKTSLVRFAPQELGPETKWRALDQQTRIELANEMFLHVKDYLRTNPDQKAIVIEPGGGNAELSVILAKQLAQDPVTANQTLIIVREFSPEMIDEGREKIKAQGTEKLLPIEFIAGTAETALAQQLSEIKQALSEQSAESLGKFHLTPEQAKQLLEFVNGAKVVGGISTYAAGAMSTSDGLDTTTTRIFSTLANDVDREGLILINDFATPPPAELLSDSQFTKVDREKIAFLRSVAKSFAEAGFSHGLATVYGLWGEGVGHDVRQIWQTYLKLLKDGVPGLSFDANLRPFTLFPIPLHHRYLVIPGFTETTIRGRGQATSGQLKV